MEHDPIRENVRAVYGAVAMAGGGCGGGGCCTPGQSAVAAAELGRRMGYSAEDLSAVPDGAQLGLGCGNPQAIAELAPGEVVLDLGAGAGFDCFLAARAVGPAGRVIGVDMTPEMVAKARRNAAAMGLGQVEFRLGEIESLPVEESAIDVVISNCVLNLSTDKERALGEAFRVLRPGGRLAISDLVMMADLPEGMAGDPALHAGCIAGAATRGQLLERLAAAGFVEGSVTPKADSAELIREWAPGRRAEDYIVSAAITARKPPTRKPRGE